MKTLLFDADGVVILRRDKYFSERFSERANVPIEEIIPFFKNEYKETARGNIDIRDALPAYLKRWNFQGSVDDFLSLWYEGEKELDQSLLEKVRALRKEGVKVCLVSDNEAGRAHYLENEVGLGKEFDICFWSADLHATKSEPLFFEKVLEKLGISADQALYFDDDPKNIEVAKSVGIEGFVYENFEQFEKQLS